MAEKIASSGVLTVLAHVLRKKSPLTSQVTLLVAEMAREGKAAFVSCFYYVCLHTMRINAQYKHVGK